MGPEQLSRFLEKLAHERGAPAVPERWVGGVDVRHRERVEVAEALLRFDLLGEGGEHLGIADVLALSHIGHEEVLAHEPAHQFPIGGLEAVALGKCLYVLGAEGGVVAAAPLRDIVVEPSDVEKFGLGNLAHALVGHGVAILGALVEEAPQVPQEQHGVRIHGVDVEKIVLHLSDDAAEFGQIASEHAIAPHARELGDQPMGASQQG